MTDFITLLKAQRSYRAFDESVKITKEQLLSMAQCVALCPSSANLQAIKLRLVRDEKECAEVLSATKWAGYLKNEQIPPVGKAPAAYIIVGVDTEITSNVTLFYKDTGIVAQSIMLKACEMGFGGCMIGSFDKAALEKALALPKNFETTLVLALGKPCEEVQLCPVTDGDTKYFRKNGVHYVPKRSIEEIIIK